MVASFVLCLLGFTLIGSSSARASRGTRHDYYLADGNVPPWLVGLSAVATNNSGYMFIGVIGYTYATGFPAIWLMLGWLLGGRATKEERRTAAIRCATRDSALKQCVVANSKETCDRLAQDLDLCKVRLVGNVRCRYRTRARARARPTRASRRRRVAPAGLPIVGTTARSSKLAVFPPRDSTGKGGVSRRGRRVLPMRAPRRQPHRQAGRRPRLLETVEKDARVPSTRAGLT